MRPGVKQILETALEVADLDRSERFYQNLFGFPTILSKDRLRVLSVHDRQVLLLFLRGASSAGERTPGGFIPGHDAAGTLHMAFEISSDSVELWRRALAAANIEIESHLQQAAGAESLYFRDPDRHLIELATARIWNFKTE